MTQYCPPSLLSHNLLTNLLTNFLSFLQVDAVVENPDVLDGLPDDVEEAASILASRGEQLVEAEERAVRTASILRRQL